MTLYEWNHGIVELELYGTNWMDRSGRERRDDDSEFSVRRRPKRGWCPFSFHSVSHSVPATGLTVFPFFPEDQTSSFRFFLLLPALSLSVGDVSFRYNRNRNRNRNRTRTAPALQSVEIVDGDVMEKVNGVNESPYIEMEIGLDWIGIGLDRIGLERDYLFANAHYPHFQTGILYLDRQYHDSIVSTITALHFTSLSPPIFLATVVVGVDGSVKGSDNQSASIRGKIDIELTLTLN